MSLHYSWGNPLNCLYTIFKVVKILTLILQTVWWIVLFRQSPIRTNQYISDKFRQLPTFVTIIIIVSWPFFICFFHQFLSGFCRNMMDMHQSFYACFFGSRNEYIDATGMVTQNVVGTSADKQTRLFFCQFTYYIALYFEQSVIAQTTAIGNGSVADKRKTCSE